MAPSNTPPVGQRYVWPAPIRALHWILAGLVLYNLWGETGPEHRLAGYVAASLVALRLLAGRLVPTSHPVRLGWPTVSRCQQQARQIMAGKVASGAEHSPLGAAMSLLIWGLVLLLGLTGWISRWDMFWGDDWIINIHATLSLALSLCVGLHLLGVAISSHVEKQNLAKAMVTGYKRVDD